MTLLVRDEEDVLKANLDYHFAQGVDFVIATDNRSLDSTADILKSYEKKGKLLYIFEGDDDYSQHKWVTRMARMAYTEYNASWVINSDADEFWWVVGGGSLDVFFMSIKKEINIVEAPRNDFAPPACLSKKDNFYDHMIYRKKDSMTYVGKKVLPKRAHRGASMVEVGQGNHNIYNIGDQVVANAGIEILHFPVRSYEQFLNKIINGGRSYSKNKVLPARMGNEWRALYEIYRENGDLRDSYRKLSYCDDGLEKFLAEGAFEYDVRLRDFFIIK